MLEEEFVHATYLPVNSDNYSNTAPNDVKRPDLWRSGSASDSSYRGHPEGHPFKSGQVHPRMGPLFILPFLHVLYVRWAWRILLQLSDSFAHQADNVQVTSLQLQSYA